MDFRQTTQPNTNRPVAQPVATVNHEPKEPYEPKNKKALSKWMLGMNLVVLLGVTVLLASIALVFTRASSGNNEFKYVDTSKYQAVFLNNGQVYFGNINSLNSKYLQLTDVYYLTQNSSTTGSTNNAYTLLQLGCQQIHDPLDQMLVNRDQVTFWENLNDSGQVVTRIKQLKKQGVDCSQVTSQTQATSSTTQGSSSTGTTPNTSTGTNTTGGSSTTGK